MDWMNILAQIFEIVVFPLLGVGTLYLVFLIKAKIAELKLKHDSELAKKYFNMLDKTICDAVIATNQTYVDALKKEGKFDATLFILRFMMVSNEVSKPSRMNNGWLGSVPYSSFRPATLVFPRISISGITLGFEPN